MKTGNSAGRCPSRICIDVLDLGQFERGERHEPLPIGALHIACPRESRLGGLTGFWSLTRYANVLVVSRQRKLFGWNKNLIQRGASPAPRPHARGRRPRRRPGGCPWVFALPLPKASGHQASGHNCGPGTNNGGPKPKKLALTPIECQFSVQFPVEHRGFEPRTPCLPGKGGAVLASSGRRQQDRSSSVVCLAGPRPVVVIECLFACPLGATRRRTSHGLALGARRGRGRRGYRRLSDSLGPHAHVMSNTAYAASQCSTM